MELLVRMFVKDYQNTEEIRVRTAYGVLLSVTGICCNCFLFILKFTVGMLMSSVAVTADGFNNLSDAASAVIALVGVKMAGKPADREHPFGHGRMEYVAALIVAFLVVEVGITLMKTSVGKILHPETPVFSPVPFLFLCLSVLIKLWMGCYNRKYGKKLHSSVMEATSADSFGDVAATGATIAALLFSVFTGKNIDGIAGLLVSLLVIWSGIGIIRDVLSPLIGDTIDPELGRMITEIVEAQDGIVGTHDLIVHNYGPGRSMASIHAEVPRETDIEESHAAIDCAETKVQEALGVYLVIHMDPVEIHDARVLELKKKVARVLAVLDESLAFHDFQVIFGEKKVIISFDLVVPFSYSEKEEIRLMHQVMNLMREIDERYQCTIKLDRNYLAG